MFHSIRNVAVQIGEKKNKLGYYYYYSELLLYFHKVCQPRQGRSTSLRTGHQSHPGGGQARLYQRLVQGSTRERIQDIRVIRLDYTTQDIGVILGVEGIDCTKVYLGFDSTILSKHESHPRGDKPNVSPGFDVFMHSLLANVDGLLCTNICRLVRNRRRRTPTANPSLH